jgi:hypothetical protein
MKEEKAATTKKQSFFFHLFEEMARAFADLCK